MSRGVTEAMVEAAAKAILDEGMNFGALAHHLKGEHSIEMRLARAALTAAIAAEPGAAEMVLVPREPNDDQLRQLFSMNSALPRTTEEATAVYHAILNCAAPHQSGESGNG